MRIIGYAKARVGQPFHLSARKGLEGSRRRRGGPWRLVVGALSYAGQLNIATVADRDGCPTGRYSHTVCRTPPMSCRPNLNREPKAVSD
jgi:hypothetical protein